MGSKRQIHSFGISVYQDISNSSFLFHSIGIHGRERTEVNGVVPSDGGIPEMGAMVLNGICNQSEARCSKEAVLY